MDLLTVVVGALWAMLPAYVPNNAAVLFGGGPPVDAGRTLGGARLLGDGKTWRGTVAGIGAGLAVAGALNLVRPAVVDALGVALAGFPLRAAVGLAAGAMLGDVVASFAKRRLDRERGAAAPGLDQLDFVVGALALAAVVAPAWTRTTFSLAALAVVVAATPLLHLLTNAAAYGAGLKAEPW
ncbi:MAG: CDP-diglyceride synthetase [uncultured archaeon A07HB70]|nr:MAG: CDP-diglyceride synthetase [uncultured archaeon A07HB70]